MAKKVAALYGRGVGPKVFLGQLTRPRLRVTQLTGVVRVSYEFSDGSVDHVEHDADGMHAVPRDVVYAVCTYHGDSTSFYCEFIS